MLTGIIFDWSKALLTIVAVVTIACLLTFIIKGKYYDSQIKKMLIESIDSHDYFSVQSNEMWAKIPYHELLDEIVNRQQKEMLERKEAEEYDRQSTLQALQSQINPHFLYNTLECIRGQALIDNNQDIASMLEQLGCFFRYSISRKDNVVTLLDEIQNIQEYTFIQNYRFPDRFKLVIDYLADEEMLDNCYVPKLMLQPIVENSILHAFENKTKGIISIEIDADDSHLLITVSDDGDGMNEATLNELNARIQGKRDQISRPLLSHGNGIALENVNKRINILFGSDYGMHVYSTPKSGTDVEIVLPRESNDNSIKSDKSGGNLTS